MDSIKTYESSLQEIKAIEKRMCFDELTINFNRLDGKTKEDIINTLSNTIARRKQAIIDTIQGVK